MFKDILKLAKESIIYGLSTVIARFFNFLLVPFYSYFLLTSEYGIVSVLFSYIALLSIVYHYGMEQAYMRFASEKDTDKKNVFSTPFWVMTVTSLFFSVVIVSNSKMLFKLLGLGSVDTSLVLYGVSIITLDALAIVPFAKLRMEHRAWTYAGIKILWVVVNVVSNIVLVGFFKLGVKGVFISAFLSSLAVFMALIPLILKSLGFILKKELFLRMFKFAWPFVPAGFAAAVVQVIDKPILMYLTDSSTVGIYQANYKFGIFMLLVVAMFAQAWMPFYLEHAKKENAKEMFSKILTYFAVCGVWIIFAVSLFIGDVIKTQFFGYYLLHPDYWAGIGIIPIILTGYLFYGFYVNFTTAPILSKKTHILVNVTLIGAAVNILANLVLIGFFGMFGAAWASFAGYAVMAFALVIFANKFYRVPYEWRRIVHLAFIAFGMLIFYYFAKIFMTGKLFFTAKGSILIIFPVVLFLTGFFTEREIGAIKRRIFKKSDT